MYYGNDEDSWEESLTSGLRGVQPCITCNKALGGNATTLRPGAWSVKECICNPGELISLYRLPLGQPHVVHDYTRLVVV
jgi:hypothetical protein